MMQSETLDIIKRSASIPSIPMVATRCYEMTQNSDCDYNKLVELLGTDPGIAASILRLANSPLFGVTRQVSSLKHAITLLGVKRIRELVLTRYLVQKTEDIGCENIDINYYWRLSVATGILAAKFAESLAPRQRDEAFMGGLLADVGVLVLARALPKQYESISLHYQPHESDDWIQGEYNLMGVTHGEVSALVLEQWNLPDALVEGVRYHHATPADMPENSPGTMLARMIGGASGIAKVLSQTSNVDSARDTCRSAMERVNLDISVLVRALDGIEEEIEKMADLLQIDVLNSKVFTLICKQLVESLEKAESVAG